MGRFFTTLLTSLFSVVLAFSQCPDLPANSSVSTASGGSGSPIGVCGAENITFDINDVNLPSGTIDWYSSTTAGFDPLTTGTLIGSSTVTSVLNPCSTCPEIEALYIDVCNDLSNSEADNEFMIISSGSGFDVNDLSLLFPNSAFGSPDSHINTGDLCNWTDGDLSLISGCGGTNLISAGPGDYIPENALVIIQTSVTGTLVNDMSSICGLSDCVYVLSNACDRNSAGFKNCDVIGGTRTVTIELNCGCSDPLTYDINDICSGGGGGTFYTDEGLTGNNGCEVAPTIIPQDPLSQNSSVDQFNYNFSPAECNSTQYIVGVLNSNMFNEDCCGALANQTDEYAFSISCATAELSGTGDLCPEDCVEISVGLVGGNAPYILDLTFTGGILPIPITLPGFPVDGVITICYDTGDPIVDPSTNTVNVPAFAGGFSGTLTLNSFTDDNGCDGVVNGSGVSISFNDNPAIITPPALEECDLGAGTAFFILTDLDNIINGGTATTVLYFSDEMGTMPISSPYETGSTTIYAQIDGSPCDSDIIPVELIVVTNGDVGAIELFCNEDGNLLTECTICDDDNIAGEMVELTIVFQDQTVNHDFEIVWTAISGPSSTITGSGIGSAVVTHNVFETTTFEITVVTADGGCPDMTDLGSIVTVNYSLEPQMQDPGNLMECGSVTLPDILGDVVPANAAYYDMPAGQGTLYSPGDIISSDITLYLYAGINDCEQEFEIEVTISGDAIIDQPSDVNACGSYQLPPITGTNVENASYYTEIDGGGSIVADGTVITSSIMLFLFDPNCTSNQPELNITISPGPAFENNADTLVCDTFFLLDITGNDLTGNEAYYSQPGGLGNLFSVGDTITEDSTIYIFDNTPGCNVEIPITIQVNQQAFPGEDASIAVCEGDETIYNLLQFLGTNVDTFGIWSEISTSGEIIDSTSYSFENWPIGVYSYRYEFEDDVCIDTSAILQINITGSVYAGVDSTLTLCSDLNNVNVFDLIGNPDLGGTFIDQFGITAPFDPLDATFVNSNQGSETFQYLVGDPNSSCGSDTSTLTLNYEPIVDAGLDNQTTICAGLNIALIDLLNGNSSIGIFEDPDDSGGLSGMDFQSSNVPDGEYTIYHIVAGSGNCPADTAILTLTVVDGPSAGDEIQIDLCGEELFDLSSLVNGDSNGDYYENGTLLTSSIVDLAGQNGTSEYLYIVGDGVSCPLDTAVLTLNITAFVPVILTVLDTDICSNECAFTIFDVQNLFLYDLNVFFHIEGSNGDIDNRLFNTSDQIASLNLELCEGVGLLTDDIVAAGESYTIVLDSIELIDEGCTYLSNGSSVAFNVGLSGTSTLDGTYCLDSEVTVGDDVYDQFTPSGTTTLPNESSNGCDSIVTVDLTFQLVAEGEYLNTLCFGEEDTVLGVTYTDDFVGDTLLVGGSINGCDSLVMITIDFTESTPGAVSETICQGESITIEGVEFMEVTVDEEILLPGGSVSGCDSSIIVNIAVNQPTSSPITGQFCSGYSIVVNGNTYDVDEPVGIEIISGAAANGCDSIYEIDLDFSLPSIDSSFVFATCDDSYFLVVGSQIFNRTNPSGSAILAAANNSECDTLLNIDITYGEMNVDYIEMDAGCEVIDSGSVTIEAINGVAPYNIIYNGNNTIAFTLPVVIPLPVGQGELMITDDGGCMTTLPYEIFEGEEGDFSLSQSGSQILLLGGIPDSILWTPEEGLSCNDCIDPFASPEQTTEYLATISYGGTCELELSYLFLVEDNIPDYILPAIFSPNGDNQNDKFTLFITEGAIGIPESMEIFDRWGNLMYSENAPEMILSEGWDGTLNGSDVDSGVYVYKIVLNENGQFLNIFGDLTVVR